MSTVIIDKLNLFTTWIVTTAIVFVVGLVIFRVIAGYAELNFFGWTYVTIRRLTDPLIGPVRRALSGFRVDPKYAPLVTILITILLGWILLQATDTVLSTIAGVMSAVQRDAVAKLIGYLLLGSLRLYGLMIFVRIVFSWAMVGYSNRVMRFLFNTTEPLLGPLRRAIRPVGMFDISAFVAIIILWLLQAAIQGTLLRG